MLYLTTDLRTPAEYCTSGRFVSDTGGAVHPDRLLSTYVVLFGSEGEYRIRQNGTEYALTPGTYLILLAGFRHAGTAPCLPGLKHYWCHFFLHGEVNLIDEESMEKTADRLRRRASEGGANDLLLLPEFGRVPSPERIQLLFHSLIDKSRGMDAYREKECDLILTELLCELSDAFLAERAGTDRGQATAAKIVEYIRSKAASVGSVAEIAEIFGYNPEYMTTVVRRATGLSVLEHINRAKMEEAKRLLLSTGLTVAEIAQTVGYADARYFARLFRRQTDLTPSEYRNTYFKIHTNRE